MVSDIIMDFACVSLLRGWSGPYSLIMVSACTMLLVLHETTFLS